jgi:hypothetical protein
LHFCDSSNDLVSLSTAFCLESYGVRIRFEVENEDLARLTRRIAKRALVDRLRFGQDCLGAADHEFRIYETSKGLVFEDESGASSPFKDASSFETNLNSMIRVHVGTKAKEWVFVHCGVVAWKGKAILVPGHSRQGKTTLVAELIRAGAEYYSDEFAVIDADGLIHPFERDLSVRINDEKEVINVSSLSLGAKAGEKAVPAGLVLLTKFEPEGEWNPTAVSLGEGILEVVPNVLPMRFNTEFTLRVLNTAFSRAIIARSLRGEARETAPLILSFFEEHLNSA